MSMQQVLSTWISILPYLQLSLAGWQILKFTPLVGIIQGVIGWLLWPLFPGFFPSYALLRRFPGRVFKKVKCVVLTNTAGLTKAGRRDTSYTPLTGHFSRPPPDKPPYPPPDTPPYRFSYPSTDSPSDIEYDDHLRYIEGQMTYVRRASVPRPSAHVGFASVPPPLADVRIDSVSRPSNATASNTNVEQDRPTTVSMHYLGDDFKLRYDKPKLFVQHKNNEKMSHYISDIQWDKIHQMNDTCFKSKMPNKVVFIKGYKDFWEKKGSGNVMTFDEVLDCVIDEKTGVSISRNFEALPVDLSQKSNEIISNLLNLVGLFFSVVSAVFFEAKNFSSYLSTVFSIVSGVLQFTPVASWIYGKINMVVCRSLQCIFDKLPYSMRRQVYSLDMWVQNLAPCNDIQFKVVRDTTITVVIGGAAKTNDCGAIREPPFTSENEAIREPFSFFDNKLTFVYDLGYNSLVIKAEYNEQKHKCIAILNFADKISKDDESKNRKHRRVSVKCKDTDDFYKICTFLKCVAETKAGSLISYDKKKKKVVVRSWRESVRHYVEAGLPDVYKVTLHDVTM